MGEERTLVRQECERQKCERHQCEANRAYANSAKGSMRQECQCQMCVCQQCDATSVRKKCDNSPNVNSANGLFLLKITNTDFGFGRNEINKKREPAKRMHKVTCCPTRSDLLLFQFFFVHTFNLNASMIVHLHVLIQEEKREGESRGLSTYG